MLASAIAQQRRRVDLLDALLDAADLQRRQAALVVRRDRHALDDPLDLLLGEPVGGQPLARARGDQLLRARARRHARRRHADDAPRAVLEGHGAAEQRVDLLRLDARDGRRLVLGVARGDRDLGARGLLALAHELGDVLRERLGAERRLAEHDLADRLVDDLLEARHVRALLLAAEIDEALQAREEQLVADAHDLLDAGDADAREADRNARARAPARRRRRPARRGGETLEPIACTPASVARAWPRRRRPRGAHASCQRGRRCAGPTIGPSIAARP